MHEFLRKPTPSQHIPAAPFARRWTFPGRAASDGQTASTGTARDTAPDHAAPALRVQPKLTIGATNDPLEHEADRIADEALRMPEPSAGNSPSRHTNTKDSALRAQTEASCAGNASEVLAPPLVRAVLNTLGQPLDRAARAFMEPRFGADFSAIRVHSDADAAQSALSIGARAYASGNHLVFGPAEYQATAQDHSLLAHELAHVVQSGGKSEAGIHRRTFENDEKIKESIAKFDSIAKEYSSQGASMDEAKFDATLNSLFTDVIAAEGLASTAANHALLAPLHTAYKSALKSVMALAAPALKTDERTLYRKNNGRIPLWAWQTPHHVIAGFSAPVPETAFPDAATGVVSFKVSAVTVRLLPDSIDTSIEGDGNTRYAPDTSGYHYKLDRYGKITSFDPPKVKSVDIRTRYKAAGFDKIKSGYGRGTTAEDQAGAKTLPWSSTLGFHEGNHTLAYIAYMEGHPLPAFVGRAGMTAAQFRAAADEWYDAVNAYFAKAAAFSKTTTDSVGFTLEEYDAKTPGQPLDSIPSSVPSMIGK